MPLRRKSRAGGIDNRFRFHRFLALLFAGAALATVLNGGEPAVDAVGDEALMPVGTRGRVNIEVTERRLGDVLQYLERVGGWNLVPVNENINELLVTVRLTNMFWRDALDVIATKYKLILREEAKAQVIYVEQPPLIEMNFRDTDIKEVINAIAKMGDASVVIGPGVQGTITMSIKQVPWREALDIVLKTLGYVLVEEKHGVLRVATPEELKQQMETRVFRLSYLTPEGARYTAKIETDYATYEKSRTSGRGAAVEASLKAVLEKVKTSDGSIAFEKRTNAVVITDTPSKLEDMALIIRELDVPPKQVHLSIKFIEMSDSDSEELGINWGPEGITASISGMAFDTMFPFAMGPADHAFKGTIPGEFGVFPGEDMTGAKYTVRLDQVADMAGGAPPTLGRLDMLGLQAVLGLIQTHTNARVIQAPEITCLDHEEATIMIGDLIRYAESEVVSTPDGSTASGWREARRSPVRLGTQVLVIPHVTGPENNVMLTVIPKIEKQTGAELFEVYPSPTGDLKLPLTSERTIVTKMMLRNRETGVIAGLRYEVRGESITKIPILGDIPIIGWLFKRRSRPEETNRTNNIIILVTPTVVDFQERYELKDTLSPARKQLRDIFTVYGE
jgi:type IV pilus assembly protein PilQ